MNKSQRMLISVVIFSIVGSFGIMSVFQTYEECTDSRCPPVNSQVTDFRNFLVEGVVDAEKYFPPLDDKTTDPIIDGGLP